MKEKKNNGGRGLQCYDGETKRKEKELKRVRTRKKGYREKRKTESELYFWSYCCVVHEML